MVSNSPSYLLRLWPPFLNKLLYATDAGPRRFCGLGVVGRPREAVSCAALTACRSRSTRRLRSFYDSRHGDGPRLFGFSKHRSDGLEPLPEDARSFCFSRPGHRGRYYVDLDAVTRYPWTVDPPG